MTRVSTQLGLVSQTVRFDATATLLIKHFSRGQGSVNPLDAHAVDPAARGRRVVDQVVLTTPICDLPCPRDSDETLLRPMTGR